MAGTIILTGANGSVAMHTAEQLLKAHPDFTFIFTVRDAAETDPNTQNLRQVIARYPDSKVSIHQVDQSSLTVVHEFASKISAAIAAGEYPRLQSIICNASYWNLVGDSELTVDGYDKTLQVNHISHVALVLRLIGSFAKDGRIVLLSSIGHYRKPNAMTSHLPEIPDDMERLNHPPSDKDKQGRGFQRMPPDLCPKNPEFKDITVVTVNPGGIGDSRVFTSNTPRSVKLQQKFIMKPFMSVIHRLVDPTFRSAAEAGVELAELAVDKARPGERGYFTLLEKDESDPITMDEDVQKRVWQKSLEWAKITKDNTALKEAVV
ncbi:hypothetical protein MGN70_003809 [Eutypa lata]|nr:hypothetical protein MGN70_003809 [Eutypa lata]